jgi:hypothetical protein
MSGSTKMREKPLPRDKAGMLLEDGTPKYNRRLTDKILDAFNQAYKSGELELAQNLRWILNDAESRGQERYMRRQSNQASQAATDWIDSIDKDSNSAVQGTILRRDKPIFK